MPSTPEGTQGVAVEIMVRASVTVILVLIFLDIPLFSRFFLSRISSTKQSDTGQREYNWESAAGSEDPGNRPADCFEW